MSQMSTVPVFRCKYCGKAVYVTELRTTKSDPDAEMLYEFMRNLKRIAICNSCKRKYNYMASQGRADEFLTGMLSPIDLDK